MTKSSKEPISHPAQERRKGERRVAEWSESGVIRYGRRSLHGADRRQNAAPQESPSVATGESNLEFAPVPAGAAPDAPTPVAWRHKTAHGWVVTKTKLTGDSEPCYDQSAIDTLRRERDEENEKIKGLQGLDILNEQIIKTAVTRAIAAESRIAAFEAAGKELPVEPTGYEIQANGCKLFIVDKYDYDKLRAHALKLAAENAALRKEKQNAKTD